MRTENSILRRHRDDYGTSIINIKSQEHSQCPNTKRESYSNVIMNSYYEEKKNKQYSKKRKSVESIINVPNMEEPRKIIPKPYNKPCEINLSKSQGDINSVTTRNESISALSEDAKITYIEVNDEIVKEDFSKEVVEKVPTQISVIKPNIHTKKQTVIEIDMDEEEHNEETINNQEEIVPEHIFKNIEKPQTQYKNKIKKSISIIIEDEGIRHSKFESGEFTYSEDDVNSKLLSEESNESEKVGLGNEFSVEYENSSLQD